MLEKQKRFYNLQPIYLPNGICLRTYHLHIEWCVAVYTVRINATFSWCQQWHD